MRGFDVHQPIRKIAMSYTMRCTAECAHCCTDSTPMTNAKIDLADALGWLDQIKEAGIGVVVFVGGEVMMYYKELLQIMDKGRALGLVFRMVTNGYWGTSPRQARSKLEELRDHGLATVCVSWDLYHEPYIPLSAVKNILLAAAELRMPRAVPWVKKPGDEPAFEEMVRGFREDSRYGKVLLTRDLTHQEQYFLELFFPNVLDYFRDVLFVKEAGLVVGGRVESACNGDWERKSIDSVFKFGCSQIVRDAIIQPDGEILYCCSPAAFGDNAYSMGSLKKERLVEILSRIEADPFTQMVRSLGPYRLYQMMKEEGHAFPEDVSDMCHLCRLCLRKAGGQDGVRRMIASRRFAFDLERSLIEDATEGLNRAMSDTAQRLMARIQKTPDLRWGDPVSDLEEPSCAGVPV